MKAVANIQPFVYKWFISISKSILLLLGCLLVYSTMLFSQEENKKNVKFSGSANITDNFYSASGIAPRQPGNMLTGIIRANLTLFDQIELPFELYLSTEQTRFQQPFNQFGVSPKISDWLTLHAGYFSTRISDFTFGDLRMLWGGFELTPGKFFPGWNGLPFFLKRLSYHLDKLLHNDHPILEKQCPCLTEM